jgi:3-hydroxybutyryl-CoA dehydratase
MGVLDQAAPTYRTLTVGQVFTGRMTVTESHVVLAAGIFGDFAPLHTDEEYARKTRFGTRIAHGTLITGIMAGVLAKNMSENALGYLEQNAKFVAPVFIGDTVETTWTVAEKIDKPRLGGGIVLLDGECRTQNGTVVVTARSAMIVGDGA